MEPMNEQIGPEGRPILGFGEAVKICLKKYFDFTGRARRSEYWWFALFTFLVNMVCSFLDGVLNAVAHVEFLYVLSGVLFLIPATTVTFRRLHDIGRSGWWFGAYFILLAISVCFVWFKTGFNAGLLLDSGALYEALSRSSKVIALVPLLVSFVVFLIIFIFSFRDSQREENKYGPSPKYQ